VGELVVGKPTPKQLFAVSAPLELTSAISLAFRAGRPPAAGDAPLPFDRWVFEARDALEPTLRHDLDLLLGFSGRLLNYIEELLFSFDALAPERLDATFDDYYAHLTALPPSAYQAMATTAVLRLYEARGVAETAPASNDRAAWRMFLRPGIVGADLDEAAALLTSPVKLRERTLALLDAFWNRAFGAEYERRLPELRRAVRTAQALQHAVIEVTFSELAGQQLPDELAQALPAVRRVTYSPSPFLGSFIQYILYPPELILYFDSHSVTGDLPTRARSASSPEVDLAADAVLDGLRALSDPSRLKIVDMLRAREMYAQEIVGRLGISQSAVSRHLGTLESARIVAVRPANGMKYYRVDRDRLRALAAHLDGLAALAQPA